MKTLPLLIAVAIAPFSLAAYSQEQQTSSVPEAQKLSEEQPLSKEQYGHYKRHHKKHGARIGKAMFKRMDTNDDRKLDLNEFLSHSEQRFNMMDLNSDGYVTPQEAREAAGEMRKKHHAAMREARSKRKHADESVE